MKEDSQLHGRDLRRKQTLREDPHYLGEVQLNHKVYPQNLSLLGFPYLN